MNVRIQYQGGDGTPWMRNYLESKLTHLERYLSPTSTLEIEIINGSEKITSRFYVKTLRQEYSVIRSGMDIFEAFTTSLDEVTRVLRRDHLKLREKYHKRFTEITGL